MTRLHAVAIGIAASSVLARAELRVPACTAYLDPNPDGARVSSSSGITGWSDPANHILWFGELKATGQLTCAVSLRLPAGTASKLRLTVGEQSREATATGGPDGSATADFGAFEISVPVPGYRRFALESLNGAGRGGGNVDALRLDGPAAADAHFNLEPRRNTASVHLFYPLPRDLRVTAFYCEATAVEDPVCTFYMACGWHRGYFGMQVNSPTERRIIFSVWDSGNEPVSRDRVEDSDRVKLVEKGEDVFAGDFGHEGTGGHSHLKYMWKTGQPQRFVVTAQPAGTNHTVFAGYYFHPDRRAWVLISAWDAPHEKGGLRGLHSFSENFAGHNGHLRRKCLFGNPWVRTAQGEWRELTRAGFSHDETGARNRLDRFGGVEGGPFFLSSGGFVAGSSRYGEIFERPPGGRPPVLQLPPAQPGR